MARRVVLATTRSAWELHEETVAEYRHRLTQIEPEPNFPWPPVRIGPTWQRDEEGRFILPKWSVGWDLLGWTGVWLQYSEGRPWRFTNEQARFILHWYAVHDPGEYPDGKFVYNKAVLQRLKGWGKDPLIACLAASEWVGPCRVGGFENDEPWAVDVPNSWVQTAAVSLEQTKNTMALLPGLFTAAAVKEFGLQIGKEKCYASRGTRRLEAVTSSPRSLQGNRATAVFPNETHEWIAGNEGHAMEAVLEDNATKSPDGGARTCRITNAYEPGEESVAERDREGWEKIQAGEHVDHGFLYDSLEANPHAPLTEGAIPFVIESIRGDSHWSPVDRITQRILDPSNPPSRSRRFWYNQITAREDAWVSPQQWDSCKDESLKLEDGDEIVLFFDGSKSDDNTALTACRVSDGSVFCRRVWARPPETPGWTVPRDQVDERVRADFEAYDVVAFWADPGAGEDESGERYWDAYIDAWARDFGGDGPSPEALCVWPVEGGHRRHAVLWDMRDPAHVKMFTEGCERALADIESRTFRHDGHRLLRQHALNARRWPNRYGVSIGKESKSSPKKVDAVVTAIAARMLWRIYLALPESKKRRRVVPPKLEVYEL